MGPIGPIGPYAPFVPQFPEVPSVYPREMAFLRKLADSFFLTKNRRYRAIVAMLFLVAAWLRLSHPGVCYFNTYVERDWIRTYEMLKGEAFHLAGAELTQGGRLPGPWHYLLQLGAMIVTPDPVSLFILVGLLSVVALYIAYRFGVRFFGERAGLFALALFAVFPIAVIGLRYLWNPTFLFAFTAGALYCLASTLLVPRRRYLIALAILIPFTVSFHISGIYLIPLCVVFFLLFRPGYSRKDYGIATLVFFLMFAPFLVGEILNGFQNVRPVVSLSETVAMAGLEIPTLVSSRYSFNPSAFHAFSFNVYPRVWDEYPYFGSFSYYTLFVTQFPDYFPAACSVLMETFFALARVHFGVYLAAMIYAVVRLVTLQRNRRPETAPLRGALFITVALPAMVLLAQSFLVVVASPKGKGSGVHYFYIIAPTQFWVIAFLLSELLEWKGWKNLTFARAAVVPLFTFWIVLQGLFVGAELNWSARSGWFIQWIYLRAPNLATLKKTTSVLVDVLDVSYPDYITNVKLVDPMIGYQGAEQGIDFLMRIHPRDEEPRSRSDSAQPSYYYVIDPEFEHFKPLPPAIATYEAGPVRILVSRVGEPAPLAPLHHNRNLFDNPMNKNYKPPPPE